jgi:inosose dehydratase
MSNTMDRRGFLGSMGAALGLAASTAPMVLGQPKRRLKIGHTGITWRDPQVAIRDIAGQGFAGFETFGNTLEQWEAKGGLKKTLDENNLPLISAYCDTNLTADATQRAATVEKIVRWAKIVKSYGGTTAVIGPNGVRRSANAWDFAAHKADIIATLNDVCSALTDIGIVPALHQHTGTCIETRDEVYAVLEGANTKVLRFGPDVGQLQKGGSDPVKIVSDFKSLIRHVHLKDWDGGQYWSEYCPLGKGKVNLPAVLDVLESVPEMKIIMVELDANGREPVGPLETVQIAKAFLEKQGYTFRS